MSYNDIVDLTADWTVGSNDEMWNRIEPCKRRTTL